MGRTPTAWGGYELAGEGGGATRGSPHTVAVDESTSPGLDRDAYIHTYIHTKIHTYKHTYLQTYRHACMHTCIDGMGNEHCKGQKEGSVKTAMRE